MHYSAAFNMSASLENSVEATGKKKVSFLSNPKQGQCQRMFKVKVLVFQLGPTHCNSMDCTLSGFSVHEILQAGILEWVAMPFSRRSSLSRDQTQVSCIAGGFFPV